MLHNVLAAANLPPVSTAYNVDETSNTYALIKEPPIPKLPTLTGALTTLSLPQCGGLPLDLTRDERKALRLSIIQAVVRELTAHKYTGVKYTKHKGIGEVISEHYDIRIGDEVIAFLYKPLACHSYNTIRIDNDSIRIATIDTMLSFYLAFIYANRIYYDINRILCMSQFLFDVQQHNRFKQTGLLKRFSINCYGNQPTLESMRFEKTEKYEELKNKRDTREYEEWFLRYIPYENAGKKKANKPAAASASGSKTRKRKQTKE
jgi:hypothetical protein